MAQDRKGTALTPVADLQALVDRARQSIVQTPHVGNVSGLGLPAGPFWSPLRSPIHNMELNKKFVEEHAAFLRARETQTRAMNDLVAARVQLAGSIADLKNAIGEIIDTRAHDRFKAQAQRTNEKLRIENDLYIEHLKRQEKLRAVRRRIEEAEGGSGDAAGARSTGRSGGDANSPKARARRMIDAMVEMHALRAEARHDIEQNPSIPASEKAAEIARAEEAIMREYEKTYGVGSSEDPGSFNST